MSYQNPVVVLQTSICELLREIAVMKLLKEDFIKSIKISKIASASIGILIYKRENELSKFMSYVNKLHYRLALYFFALAVIGEIVDLFLLMKTNFLAVTNVLPCICYCIVSLCKFMSMASNLEKSQKLLYDLEDLWCGDELNEYEVKLMTENTNNGKQVQVILTIFTCTCGIMFGVSSFIVLVSTYIKTGEIVKTLPYFIYLPWDTTGPFSYPIGYLIHLVSSYIGFVGVVLSDTFFIASVVHMSSQFKLLHYRILCVIKESLPVSFIINLDIDHNYHKNMYEALIVCIKRHSELIEMSNKLEEILSLSILLNFINSSIIICCAGFNSIAVTGVELAVFITFFGMSIYQIYALSWAGNHLIDTSSEIADAAYNSAWYLADKKFRQLIHIMIHRAQKPQVVTALGFSVVSFRSLFSILSSAYSYFTLLNTSYQNKN